LLGSFEIDHQFELRRLFDWQIARLGPFQDFVNVHGSATVQVFHIDAVRISPPVSTSSARS
jgi:hypothetical protein